MNKNQCCKKGYPLDSSPDSLGRGRIYFGTVDSHHRIVKPTVPIGEKAPAADLFWYDRITPYNSEADSADEGKDSRNGEKYALD